MVDIRTLLQRAAPKPSAPLDTDALFARAARRPRRRRFFVWLAGLVAVVGVGVPLRGALVPSDESDADRVRTVRSAQGWQVVPIADLTVEGDVVQSLALWEDHVAYVVDRTRVVVTDVRTGESRTVATPVLTEGYFTAVTGNDDWVVFTESIGATEDGFVPGDAGRFWRVAAVDLRTGREREIMRRRQPVPYPALPAPEVDGRGWSGSRSPRPSRVTRAPKSSCTTCARGRHGCCPAWNRAAWTSRPARSS